MSEALEIKREKKRQRDRERNALEHPYPCRGRDQFQCTKGVREEGAFCGACKPKAAFKLRLERRATIPIEDRRKFYTERKKEAEKTALYIRSYYLNNRKPKSLSSGWRLKSKKKP